MSMDRFDPRLTAYALGELSGPELQEMEDLVKNSEEARRHVEEVRRTAAALTEEFGAEDAPRLTPDERAKVLAAGGGSRRAWLKTPALNPYFATAFAAVVALVLALPLLKKESAPGLRPPPRAEETAPPPADAVTNQLPRMNTPPPPQPEAEAQTAANKDAAPADLAPQEDPSSLAITTASPRREAKKMDSNAYLGGSGRGVPGKGFGSAGFAPRGRHAFLPEPGAAPSFESYAHLRESDFVRVGDEPLSTFSIDVDTASYAIVRRYILSGALPPVDAVRLEELINYFPYAYAPPTDGKPFAVRLEQATAPWNPKHKLVRIGLKGREIDLRHRPKSNLVFLLDVSGSMEDENKLPLLKTAFRQLIEKLDDNDRVAIVVYAGASGLALPSTSNKAEMLKAIEGLNAGGSTNGGEGIELAYKTAQANFIPGGTNRVILATDGDFNVGVASEGELVRLIEEKAKSKIFLTVLGFGDGNYKDANMEKLADKGNGNYAYIDSAREAKKVLVEQIGGTLVTIAKDVKIQVEFNPKFASAYRLIGYENRALAKEDFNDDKKDAGEIGAGHTVTALYEIVPAGQDIGAPGVDELKYAAAKKAPIAENDSKELLTVKLRYKEPEGDKSAKLEVPLPNETRGFEGASRDLKFAAAVAEYGMILRDSKWKGDASLPQVLRHAQGDDEYRKEFREIVTKTIPLLRRRGK